ncbi:MAG: hypothetical protein HY423_10140 [Candidatus Lambdaproteobacteria bacterium]|nr:hypothetical protein [Candidatus Lambdaproteobacteria bacterium]
MTVQFYRYLSHQEVTQVQKERKIHSTNPVTRYATWYTPTRYDNLQIAQAELALPAAPTHRAGPIPADAMPDFFVPLRAVAPAFGQPGGGVEACTRNPVWLYGLWNFAKSDWEP